MDEKPEDYSHKKMMQELDLIGFCVLPLSFGCLKKVTEKIMMSFLV